MSRLAEIGIEVELNEQKIPTSIRWSATDADFQGMRACSTANITFWDGEKKSLSAISLWTVDTSLADMYAFISESLGQLAQTCQNATHDEALTKMIYACASEASRHAMKTLSGGDEPADRKEEDAAVIPVRELTS